MDDPSKIKAAARAAIADPANLVFASATSIWEIGLKMSKGKLRIPLSFPTLLQENGIAHLPFTASHAMTSISLPAIHGDPFDRALIAQCRLESMTLATRDGMLGGYGVAILDV